MCRRHLYLLLAAVIYEGAAPISTRIAFGSCSQVELPQPLWPHILARRPDAFVWGGDNVYADKRQSLARLLDRRPFAAGERFGHVPRTVAEHRDMYLEQRKKPGYARLREALKGRIYGTWDDHDMGINDGDRWFKERDERQQLHLDFLDVPRNDARRTRPGVYCTHLVGPRGARVKLILLDVRSRRDAWPWHAGATGDDMLGPTQWGWLEHELTVARDDAALILVVSGMQVLPLSPVMKSKHEAWSHFPTSKARLVSLLRKATAPAMILSGDVHFAELSEATCIGANEGTLIEFTSSGMTHAWQGEKMNWPKPILASYIMRWSWGFLHRVCGYWGVHRYRTAAFGGTNFGLIDIDADAQPGDGQGVRGGRVTLRTIGDDNEVKFERVFNLSHLVGGRESSPVSQPLSHGKGTITDLKRAQPCTPINDVRSGEPPRLSYEVRAALAAASFFAPFVLLLLLLLVGTAWCCFGATRWRRGETRLEKRHTVKAQGKSL